MKTIDIFSAILYLIPGFLFIEIFRKYFPTKRDTDFARVLHSLMWSLPLFTLSYFTNQRYPLKIPDIIISGKPINTSLVVYLYSISIILGFLRVRIRNLRFYASKFDGLKFVTPKPQSLWLKLHQDQDWAVIITKDGQRYLGYISDYTYDIDSPDDVDLLLSGADCVNENLDIQYTINGQGIYIKLSEISRIEFYKGA